jgi:hypothetical protein
MLTRRPPLWLCFLLAVCTIVAVGMAQMVVPARVEVKDLKRNNTVNFNRSGQFFVASDRPETGLQITDTKTGKSISYTHGLKKLERFEFNNDPAGNLLGIASDGVTRDIIEVETGKVLLSIPNAKKNHFALQFSLDGRRAAAYYHSGLFCVWSLPSGEKQLELMLTPESRREFQLSQDGSRAIVPINELQAGFHDVDLVKGTSVTRNDPEIQKLSEIYLTSMGDLIGKEVIDQKTRIRCIDGNSAEFELPSAHIHIDANGEIATWYVEANRNSTLVKIRDSKIGRWLGLQAGGEWHYYDTKTGLHIGTVTELSSLSSMRFDKTLTFFTTDPNGGLYAIEFPRTKLYPFWPVPVLGAMFLIACVQRYRKKQAKSAT